MAGLHGRDFIITGRIFHPFKSPNDSFNNVIALWQLSESTRCFMSKSVGGGGGGGKESKTLSVDPETIAIQLGPIRCSLHRP